MKKQANVSKASATIKAPTEQRTESTPRLDWFRKLVRTLGLGQGGMMVSGYGADVGMPNAVDLPASVRICDGQALLWGYPWEKERIMVRAELENDTDPARKEFTSVFALDVAPEVAADRVRTMVRAFCNKLRTALEHQRIARDLDERALAALQEYGFDTVRPTNTWDRSIMARAFTTHLSVYAENTREQPDLCFDRRPATNMIPRIEINGLPREGLRDLAFAIWEICEKARGAK